MVVYSQIKGNNLIKKFYKNNKYHSKSSAENKKRKN